MIRRGRFALRRIDHGFAKLARTLGSLRDGVLTVGVHADRGAEQHQGSALGVTVLEVAGLTEFGADGPGSWLRSTFDGRREDLRRELARRVRAAVRTASSPAGLNAALRTLGEDLAQEMRGRLHSLGLEKTGHLSESIEARVEAA